MSVPARECEGGRLRILYDVTKARGQRHHSGLRRVSARLAAALDARADVELVEVAWRGRAGGLGPGRGRGRVEPRPGDVYLQPEVCGEADRPGYAAWLAATPARTVAVFHDAIPLKYPDETWPKSVARHPGYMRLLGRFSAVLAVSAASASELAAYWVWLGAGRTPPVEPIALGADFDGRARRMPDAPVPRAGPPLAVLTIGILEPRKRQTLLLDACESLWREGARFSLDVVGRVNPHYGKPVRARIRAAARAGLPVRHHERLDDEGLRALYARAAFSVFPSRAEGLGLPVLESLHAGVPCLASDIPPVRECAHAGGCRLFRVDDEEDLRAGLRALIDARGDALSGLRAELRARALPAWDDCAAQVVALLAGRGRACTRPSAAEA